MKYSDPRSAEQLMKDGMMVKHYAGSHSYGTAIESSDVDFRGVFCADPVNILTPFFPIREAEDQLEEDTKLYELRHFMKLALDCNPNIIETLWVALDDVVFSTDAYQHLRSHREQFLSKKIAYTTSGYALAQLKRIKGHDKWINNPQPKESPKPYQFLTIVQSYSDWVTTEQLSKFRKDHRLVPYGHNIYGVQEWGGHQLWDDAGNLNDNYDDLKVEDLPAPVMIVKWNKEHYKTAKEKHEHYWTWKKNRNQKRSKLEEEHGFDTKHAMHLVRLLRMGVEALRDGEIVVKRPDAEELLSIRDGAWTYDELVTYAETMDKEVNDYWYAKSSLPKKPNVKLASKVLIEAQSIMWENYDNRSRAT